MRFLFFPLIIILFVFAAFLLFFGLWEVIPRAEHTGIVEYGAKSSPVAESVEPAEPVVEKKKIETEKTGQEPESEKNILLEVPFASQAPSADWENIIFQQGCEEASVLMAMMWVQGKRWATVADVEEAIILLSNFEQKTYGEFRDTSSIDTARLIRDYFNYDNIEVKSGIDARDIKTELWKGNLIIVPVNGQKLNNPFYTPPGPMQHMLVIKGYDAESKEFITNDSGTKHGNGFRYNEKILENALRDYPTGYKEDIVEINKRMIVVGKER